MNLGLRDVLSPAVLPGSRCVSILVLPMFGSRTVPNPNRTRTEPRFGLCNLNRTEPEPLVQVQVRPRKNIAEPEPNWFEPELWQIYYMQAFPFTQSYHKLFFEFLKRRKLNIISHRA